MKFPKVLVVSNNPFSHENNMGKTLSSFFRGYPSENLAQLYFHSGAPTSNVCNNYYSFNDTDALKSIVFRFKRGNILSNLNFENNESKTYDYGVYRIGKRKKPIIYLLRDLIWSLSNFKNGKLLAWAKSFNPDVIFFASGDYSFSYKNVIWLAKKLNVKIITMCFDDYYLNCEYKERFLGKLYYKKFMKSVKRIVNQSSKMVACNSLMAKEYSTFFSKQFETLYTPYESNEPTDSTIAKQGVSYIGGLSLNRHSSLLEVGEAIHDLKSHILGNKLSIYSPIPPSDILNLLNESDCIEYRGKASYWDVPNIIEKSYAVVHVESFDDKTVARTRLSLSTKIAESLCSNTLLIAYGPKNIASIDYLVTNECALVASSIPELKNKLEAVINCDDLYTKLVQNAKIVAKENHSYDAFFHKFLSLIEC